MAWTGVSFDLEGLECTHRSATWGTLIDLFELRPWAAGIEAASQLTGESF